MAEVATTKMSSRGQVVIPESIRKQLNLKAGSF
ncbi:MAG: AbrB/MazE/SpoVT family DNA-binding domain-containing protein [Syntrophorhabdus sp.]|nr:AbrB/MazE/SpoVT family DNA-binding domain-containing protein [Syntrophorhabdus sp.]